MTDITVADAMSRTLVAVSPECSIPDLEKVLRKHAVGAVPVLSRGSLVGIASAADVVRTICAERSIAEVITTAGLDLSGFDENPSDAAQFSDIAERLGCRIDHLIAADVMTTDVHTLPPTALLAEAARMMLAHRCHHVPVIDNGKPVGIVSSYDIVRFVAEGGAARATE